MVGIAGSLRLCGDTFWMNLIDGIETQTRSFVTYHRRPKYAVDVEGIPSRAGTKAKLAVVLQGPLRLEDDFTVETVKLYKRSFRDADLIVSTWRGSDGQAISRLREIGVTVVENEQPEFRGVSNINLQIVSSASGVKRAREVGAEYVIKSRTDQRIYAPNVADLLYNLTELFPVIGGGGGGYRQRKRIIGNRLNTFMYRMYGLSDMFTYGHIDDMVLFWTPECDTRVFTEDMRRQAESGTLRKFAELRICEVYLVTEFLKRIGRELKWTLRDSWSVFADHFCVVDNDQLDLFWPKYNRREFRWLKYSRDERQQEMTFRDWLSLYSDFEGCSIPEEVIDTVS